MNAYWENQRNDSDTNVIPGLCSEVAEMHFAEMKRVCWLQVRCKMEAPKSKT